MQISFVDKNVRCFSSTLIFCLKCEKLYSVFLIPNRQHTEYLISDNWHLTAYIIVDFGTCNTVTVNAGYLYMKRAYPMPEIIR